MTDATNRAAPATAAAATPPFSALARLRQSPQWRWATPEQRVVLQRIAAQRDQWLLNRLTREREAALQASAQAVDANAPLPQRLAAFARLHPTTMAAAVAGMTLAVGPKRLLRVLRSSLPTLLPLLAKLKR
ncbi:Uncharacterised protein [uncultured Comamonas sp.]|nr:Uncharacterised protein [uncultured Comamonas sp.]